MNSPRFILVLAALCLAVTCCYGQSSSQRRDTPVVPDGEYRDADGSYVLTVKGKAAVLVMKFPQTTVTLNGPVAFGENGEFYLAHQSSNRYAMYFGNRKWKWETDHFVVKEKVPPHRTLKLERQ